mmetsp:Transcript_17688/g.29729  ORF Transcript_17688/g.29729 Transcript_17688/m.29729 type:complete len:230 (+) Transcript_17688:896-1585(+)
MALRLNVVGVSNLLTLVPVLRLAGLRVPNRLGGEEVPVVLNVAGGLLNVVDENLVGLVRVHNQGVHVGELVGLAVDGLLGQQVLSLVGEDGVHPLSASAANVGAEHDAVGSVTAEVRHLSTAGGRHQLDVATTAIHLLLVLDGELEDEGLALVVERLRHLGVDGVEAGIRAGLDTLVSLLIAKPLASGQGEVSCGTLFLLEGGLVPPRLPGGVELLLVINLRGRGGCDC